jgi:hypothetical protein
MARTVTRACLLASLFAAIGGASAAFAAAPLPSGATERIALERASAIGIAEGHPSVVASTLEGAQAAMDREAHQALQPRATASPSMDAYLERAVDRVIIGGHFTDTAAKVPPGAHLPTGTTLEYAIDVHTGEVLAMHLADPPAPGATAVLARRRSRARAASWDGGKCSTGAGHHCYDLAEWFMASGTERVEGTESQIETTAMTVPEGGANPLSFVSNEKWTLFPEKSNGNGFYWVETARSPAKPKRMVNTRCAGSPPTTTPPATVKTRPTGQRKAGCSTAM